MFRFVITPYWVITFFCLVGLLIAVIIYSLSYFSVVKSYDNAKVSIYECGFDPFTSYTGLLDVRYYLVSILFIIFDLELSFLFPASLISGELGFLGFISIFFFLLILTLGFMYEWACGGLDWATS